MMVDIQELPQDSALQSLATAADPQAMLELLRPHFGPELASVKLERFTYKPGRSARLAYRLKMRDRERGLKVRHVMHGRLEPPEEIAALYAKMQHKKWVTPLYGPALLFLPELGMLLWGFPNDPKLRGLDAVAQPEKLLGLLTATLPEAAGARCSSSIVKYVPGKRLVMRHELHSPAAPAVTLFSKTYAHDRGGAIHDVMRSIWAQRAGCDLTVPEPIAYLEPLRTLVLRGLPGSEAIASLDAAHLEHGMRAAGRGLASIHTSGVTGLEPWGEAHEFENFLAATDMLQRYDPELAEPVARLRQLGQETMLAVERPAPVPIHGAFRFTQLLSYEGRLALVDFDGFRQGHPMCDVGSFVAHLYYVMTKRELSEAEARQAVQQFLQAYTGASGGALPMRALEWYAAIILVAKHAQKCVKRMKDDGDAKIRDMLALAEAILSRRAPLV